MRDYVLGVRLLTGARAQVLNFGGRVMKNVAGYDVTRLMVGALGTLGVLLEVSLKVMPQPPGQLTLTFAMSAAQAIERMNDWAGTPLPVSGTCWVDGQLYVRLHGSTAALAQARGRMGGEELNAAQAFWTSVKEHTHPFFLGVGNLWRLTVPSESALTDVPGRVLLEWTGAQRWLVSDDARADLHEKSVRAGGFATLFRAPQKDPAAAVFAALPAALMRVHCELKKTFDPHAILNSGPSVCGSLNMHTELSAALAHSSAAQRAKAIIGSCVHCGFCLATCPTYQLLGNELDSPRGRIYLIKQMLEGATASKVTVTHLDRCLTCRACETTCPSGVQYGKLLDIGRQMVEARPIRSAGERLVRWLLGATLSRRPVFAAALRAGQWLRPLLPQAQAARIPPRARAQAMPQPAPCAPHGHAAGLRPASPWAEHQCRGRARV